MKSASHIRRLLGAVAILMFAMLPASLSAQGNFVYTNDDLLFANNTVSGFSVGSNGTLSPLAGSPFLTGGIGGGGGLYASNRVIVSGNLLFASNTESADVSVFTINPSNGALTLVAGSPFSTGAAPGAISVAATPDGKFLMAANGGSNNVTVFSVAANGALAPITGTLATSQFSTIDMPDSAKVSANGKFLALAEPFISAVEMFSIASNGSLTSLGSFAGSNVGFLAGVDITCDNASLYGGEDNSSSTLVDMYGIASGGTLTPVAGSPFAPAGGRNSDVVLLSPDDKMLFITNQSSNTITVAAVGANGALALVAGSPFAMTNAFEPSGMATSPDGKLLYVASTVNMVSVFNVAANGALSEVTGSPFATNAASFHGLRSLAAFPAKSCAQPTAVQSGVEIMIKPPAKPPVPINPRAEGKIPVAILSSAAFNAVTQIDKTSLTFGHSGDEASLAFCDASGEDVNGDGFSDLVCHFKARETGFQPGDTLATMKGKLVSGGTFVASEAIVTVPRHSRDHGHDDDGSEVERHQSRH